MRKTRGKMKFYQETVERILSHLQTNIENGLSENEASRRLKKYGPNIIEEKKAKSPLVVFIQQFLSPLMFILLLASFASIIIGEINDTIVISIAVIMNVIIGFIQEWRAEKSVQALKKFEVEYCYVLRDEKKFSSIEELSYQIHKDIEKTKELFKGLIE